jgi:hypothetical protein
MPIKDILRPTKRKILSDFIFSLALAILFLSAPYFGFRNLFLNLSIPFKVLSIAASLLLGMVIYYPFICGINFLCCRKKAKHEKAKRSDFIIAILSILILNPITLGFAYSGMARINSTPCGMEIAEFTGISPAKDAGMKISEIIVAADGEQITNSNSFMHALSAKKPGDDISIATNAGNYSIQLGTNPDNPQGAFLGVRVKERYCEK